MTDAQLIAKKLAFIETCVRELRSLARPDQIAEDVREQRFVLHTLQIAMQAAQDVASHVVSDQRLGEPESSREPPASSLSFLCRLLLSTPGGRSRRPCLRGD